MNETPQNPLANLADDERATAVMIYTKYSLSWGQLITKKAILPERILVGVTVPDIITILNVQTLATHGGTLSKPIKFNELHVPYDEIIGFHLMPPGEAQIDYDPTEPNRILVPVTLHVGVFHFNANMRISAQTDIKTLLDVAKSAFLSIYDVEVSHPANPNMKPINVNLALVRRLAVLFGAN